MKRLSSSPILKFSGGMLITAAAVMGIIYAATGTADAFGTWSWKVKEPVAYKVSANGTDFRVYEWESEAVPGKFCVASFASKGPVGLDCDFRPGAEKEATNRPAPTNSDW